MIQFWPSARRALDIGTGACVGAGLVVFAAAAAGAPAPVAEPPAPLIAPPADASGRLRATALTVIDGDTFEARVAVFPGQEIVTRVRLAGVDAPERRGRCPAERDAAEAATRALEDLVTRRSLILAHVRGDKYFGRVVAEVSTAEDGDVAEALVAAGHGRPYHGGRRAGWC